MLTPVVQRHQQPRQLPLPLWVVNLPPLLARVQKPGQALILPQALTRIPSQELDQFRLQLAQMMLVRTVQPLVRRKRQPLVRKRQPLVRKRQPLVGKPPPLVRKRQPLLRMTLLALLVHAPVSVPVLEQGLEQLGQKVAVVHQNQHHHRWPQSRHQVPVVVGQGGSQQLWGEVSASHLVVAAASTRGTRAWMETLDRCSRTVPGCRSCAHRRAHTNANTHDGGTHVDICVTVST